MVILNDKITEKECYSLLETIGLPVEHIDTDRRYWFIRTQGGEYFDEFFLDGFVGIGDEDVPCVDEKDRTKELIEKVRESHPQATRALNQIHKFCKEIHKGDIVVIPSASSAQFAFGIIEEDEIYEEDAPSDEDVLDGKCPYTRRRKTHWIQGIPKSRVDSKLYTFFRNQQKLSNVDDYGEYIERALHPFYVKEGKAHFTLSLVTPESPNAFDIPLYMNGILSRAKQLYKDIGCNENDIKVQSRTNVQSAGLIELLGDPTFVALISIVVIGLFGGQAAFHHPSNGVYDGEVKTDGLAGFVLSLIDKFKDHNTIGDKQLKGAQDRLKVCDPRQSNASKQKKKHRRNKKRK